MAKVKSESLEDGCICGTCPKRFICFTNKRIFSDSIYQGLFEALMARGKSEEEALDEVIRELKYRILPPTIVESTVASNTWQPSTGGDTFTPNAANRKIYGNTTYPDTKNVSVTYTYTGS